MGDPRVGRSPTLHGEQNAREVGSLLPNLRNRRRLPQRWSSQGSEGEQTFDAGAVVGEKRAIAIGFDTEAQGVGREPPGLPQLHDQWQLDARVVAGWAGA